MWAMSGFQRMPHHWEVQSYDPKWVSDLQLAQTLFAHQKNSSSILQMGEKLLKTGKNWLGIKSG